MTTKRPPSPATPPGGVRVGPFLIDTSIILGRRTRTTSPDATTVEEGVNPVERAPRATADYADRSVGAADELEIATLSDLERRVLIDLERDAEGGLRSISPEVEREIRGDLDRAIGRPSAPGQDHIDPTQARPATGEGPSGTQIGLPEARSVTRRPLTRTDAPATRRTRLDERRPGLPPPGPQGSSTLRPRDPGVARDTGRDPGGARLAGSPTTERRSLRDGTGSAIGAPRPTRDVPASERQVRPTSGVSPARSAARPEAGRSRSRTVREVIAGAERASVRSVAPQDVPDLRQVRGPWQPPPRDVRSAQALYRSGTGIAGEGTGAVGDRLAEVPTVSAMRSVLPRRGSAMVAQPLAPADRRERRTEVRVRIGMESDSAQCADVDTRYTTKDVWQLDTRQEDREIRILLRQIELPKPVSLTAPQSVPQVVRPGVLWLVAEDIETVAGDGVHMPASVGQVTGYLVATRPHGGEIVYLTSLAVASTHRRQRLAVRLLEQARRWASAESATEILADVSARNTPALRCLQRVGFRFCGYNDRLYPNGEVALFLSLSLR
jgi:ribosomal protein S18 acetylase RimI-like enzyme